MDQVENRVVEVDDVPDVRTRTGTDLYPDGDVGLGDVLEHRVGVDQDDPLRLRGHGAEDDRDVVGRVRGSVRMPDADTVGREVFGQPCEQGYRPAAHRSARRISVATLSRIVPASVPAGCSRYFAWPLRLWLRVRSSCCLTA